jgi:hypothetical protein
MVNLPLGRTGKLIIVNGNNKTNEEIFNQIPTIQFVSKLYELFFFCFCFLQLDKHSLEKNPCMKCNSCLQKFCNPF